MSIDLNFMHTVKRDTFYLGYDINKLSIYRSDRIA